ncbi:GPI mannosyltransferase 2 [Leucoagaricus sp. SymC.cos]|nr:GPI mannosyltransferase 2 [Leucoagaricus sp. SymC.cos]
MFFSQLTTSRLFYTALAVAARFLLHPFDASGGDILVRWDALHFLDIAEHGYHWEHNFAFLPAGPFLLRHLSPFAILLVHWLLAYNSLDTLYSLSLLHLQSHHLARLAALLSLIPFSPATLYLAPYAEPFFTNLSYNGMLCCARKQWFQATVYFTLASTFRSNGVFLAGFIIWGILFPYLQQKRIPSLKDLSIVILCSALILSPFVAHNLSAFTRFCLASSPPQWCANTLPLIYNHVQSAYWNVGLFKYWSLSQLPNFLIAFPPLYALFSYALRYLFHFTGFIVPSPPAQQFFNASLAPHAIHALFMSCILLFASHTQIVLRLAPSMPFTYWAAAFILTHPHKHPFASRAWLPWAFVWSVISVVLWVAYLPPA